MVKAIYPRHSDTAGHERNTVVVVVKLLIMPVNDHDIHSFVNPSTARAPARSFNQAEGATPLNPKRHCIYIGFIFDESPSAAHSPRGPPLGRFAPGSLISPPTT